MSTTDTTARFTTLPGKDALQTTVVALEEHGFSVEVVDDGTVLAIHEELPGRIPVVLIRQVVGI